MKRKTKKTERRSSILSASRGNGNGVLHILLFVVWIAWRMVVLPYKLFIKLPNQPAFALGLFRVICWSLFLWYFDFDAFTEMVESYKMIQFFAVISPFISIIFWVSSITVMFGIHSSLSLRNYNRTKSDMEGHPSIQTTLDLMDYHLSSYKTRNDFIDSFLNRK